MSKSIALNIGQNGVANLVFDLPNEKVNKLSAQVLLELDGILDSLAENNSVKLLLIQSNKKDIFIAGADINEIRKIKNEEDALKQVEQGQSILTKIENLPFPSAAVINGACLGGGLELALACNYRIGVDGKKTQLGLPEVSLGIIPGFGGTQRLPKLIGLEESLKMILSGKAVDAKKAFKIGLTDLIVREEFLEEILGDFVQVILKHSSDNYILESRNEVKKKRFIRETLLLRKFLIYPLAKKDLLQKTKGQYPAPLAALEVIKKTYNLGNKVAGFKIEAEEFSKLAASKICKNLIELFFTNEEIKKDSGVNSPSLSEGVAAQSADGIVAKEIHKAGVLGAGVMGGGIAWLFSNYDIPIRMKDMSQNGIALGYNQVQKIYQQLLKIRKYTENQISLKMNDITSSLDYVGLKDADIVVEAIVENIEIKKKSLAELENYVNDQTIIVSNTSSLSITEMAKSLKHPERFAGMHFFNPVNKMPLVEVIKGKKTSDKTVVSIVKLSKKLGKTPIVVKDVAGFLVNRILIPYINEAGFLLQEGADLKRIDKLVENFGMPMGPFTLADTVGIDVGYKVIKVLHEAYGERMKCCVILEEISHNKELLGKKSSQGFYKYDKSGNNTGANTQIGSVVNKVTTENNIKKFSFSDQEIIDRCFLITINEAARCLEEEVVKSARYLDMAVIMGSGFPPFRGGLLRYADEFGIKNIVARLEEFSAKYDKRFAPSELLLRMAREGLNFYS